MIGYLISVGRRGVFIKEERFKGSPGSGGGMWSIFGQQALGSK